MRLWQWWCLRKVTMRWRRFERGWKREQHRRARELKRKYRAIPRSKEIIRQLDLPKDVQNRLIREVKEKMWASEGHDAKSKNTRNGT